MLDLKADRYYRLDRRHSAALRAMAGGECNAHLDARASLVAKGLIRPGDGPAATPVSAPRVTASVIERRLSWRPETQNCSISPLELFALRFMAGQVLGRLGLFRTARYYRGRRDRCHEQQGGLQRSQDRAAALAACFADQRRFFPAKRRCVPDSLALAAILWRRGCAAEVFFGVRLDPFAAHCWVQHGALLLSDPLDSVAEFTPVFQL
ncbi:lasso peptide biosynthesis B2 protein [Sphingopyxis sp. CCNWLW8]